VTQFYQSGETVPDAGEYQNTQTGDRVKLKKDDFFPPTPTPGQTFRAFLLTGRN
jgi:hypothetical protein